MHLVTATMRLEIGGQVFVPLNLLSQQSVQKTVLSKIAIDRTSLLDPHYDDKHRSYLMFEKEQRIEIQKQAAEHESALESYPHGEKGDSAFREFVKGQKLRRLSNLLSCRDPEIKTPSHSRSASPTGPDDEPDSTSHNCEDEVSNEAKGEDEDEDEDEDEVTDIPQPRKRSAYKLKPRKERHDRFTPNAYARKARKKAVVESDDDDDMEPHRKIPVRRGGKNKHARG
ncbi:hypothetical protein ACQ4PT_015944 [Festuca glaucescens]